MANISKVEILPLVESTARGTDCDGAVETLIVRLTDENGVTGLGECDAPAVATAAYLNMPTAHIWSQNIPKLLIGADPLERRALWERMYDATFWPGRRGLGIHAISAVDIALHDLAAKQIGVPVYKLLGGAVRPDITPYATIFPGMPQGRSLKQVMTRIHEQFDQALALGFRAVKMEVMFEDAATDAQLVDCIRQGRRWLGDKVTLMLDFGYRWRHWEDARWVLERVADCDIYFAEAALHYDNLAGHAKLAQRSPIRICGAEPAATRFEVREWIETGKVGVVQPNIGRCGGFTEIMRIADLAEQHDVLVIPHGWKTGPTAACQLHFQAAVHNAPFVEYYHQDLYISPLRKDLVNFNPPVKAGRMALPTKPGLGIELNPAALKRFAIR